MISLSELAERLDAACGDDLILAALFSHALSQRDDAALSAAFDRLETSPEPIRVAVQACLSHWLFGGKDEADQVAAETETKGLIDLAELPAASDSIH